MKTSDFGCAPHRRHGASGTQPPPPRDADTRAGGRVYNLSSPVLSIKKTDPIKDVAGRSRFPGPASVRRCMKESIEAISRSALAHSVRTSCHSRNDLTAAGLKPVIRPIRRGGPCGTCRAGAAGDGRRPHCQQSLNWVTFSVRYSAQNEQTERDPEPPPAPGTGRG